MTGQKEETAASSTPPPMPAPEPRGSDTAAFDVPSWRKAERKRLIAARMAVPAAERAVMDEAIRSQLESLIGAPAGRIVSAYWPFRAEPDLRPLLRKLRDAGARIALPVVVAKAQPLLFREWVAGAKLAQGVWNIPYPEDGPEVVPDLSIAPVVGFDAPCYRLGYGGGFFDMTLAALPNRPACIGVGYELQRIDTIHPQPHDIPMAAVITQSGIFEPT